MKVHFICMGNVYRSRFAEAYARSISTNHTFSSSGVDAGDHQPYGPVTWWGVRLTFKYNCSPHLTPTWTNTNQVDLTQYDKVIFMHPNVEARAQELFNLEDVAYETWKTDDLYTPEASGEYEILLERLKQSDKMGAYMARRVESLLASL